MIDFKAPYSPEAALEFLYNFLPDDFQKFDEEVKVDFKLQFIRNIRKIGEASSLDGLHVYEITHESENDPRVSLSKDSFRLLARYGIRKALIFFVSQKSHNYRLSLATVELKWDKGTKVAREFSNPRRYSFFLGPDAKVHTPCNFLIRKGRAKDAGDLLSRFDVEIVTKEFFGNYKRLYEDVRNYFENDNAFKIFASKNNIDIDTFAKKLLGQIVFCYFLQRKGWLGAKKGEPINKGDKDFMRALFNRSVSEKKNFYNDYLEHLFYGSLNNRTEGSSDFYRKHFDCQIPFLNGGLFDPPQDYDWERSFVHIPDKIFSNKENNAILDVFDLYNFTVYEDDPVDREVSVDPEMLGKVFENLLPENLRKGQGAYYTPREIVHYMCQESLINYLATETKINIQEVRGLIVEKKAQFSAADSALLEKALSSIKVCDPACGSGAFLVGMLHEIVSARRILNSKEDEYHLKKETIQDCIYGVDIDPGAVEIAKLRLWLSLVVDYELKDIEPLPNLDYKIMCGNSLLEELIIGEESIKLFDEKLLNISKSGKAKRSLFNDEEFKGKSASVRNEYLQNQLKAKQKQLLELHSKNQLTLEKRKELEQEIDAINKELNPKSKKQAIDSHPTLFGEKAEKYFNLLKELHKQYFTEYDPKKKQQKRRQIEDIEMDFIKSSIKEKVDGIEDRIRNLNMQDPSDRKQQAVLMKKKLEYLAIPEQIQASKARPYFLWKLNFFEVFQEKGGFDIVIANPPYVRQEEIIYKTALQNEYEIFSSVSDLYTYFYEKGFKLLKDFGALTFITSNKFTRARYGISLRKYLKVNTTVKSIINFGDKHVFEAITNALIFIATKEKTENNTLNYSDKIEITDEIRFSQSELQDSEWTIERPEVIHLKKKIERAGTLLKDWDIRINYGIKTGYNDAFVIDDTTRNYLIKNDQKSKEIIKPIIRGRDIKRYHYVNSGQFLIITHNGYRSVNNEDVKAININEYPSIKNHLDKYIRQLKARQDKGVTIYNLRDCAFMDDFAKEKIIWLELTNENKFAYSDKEDYLLAGAFFLVGKSMKYLLSFLNSKLCHFYFSLICNSSGMATIQWKKFALEKVPVMELADKEQKPFIDFVDKILVITKSADYLTNAEKQAKVKEYERQIDQMVYKLYGLTDEEIKIVEDFTKELAC